MSHLYLSQCQGMLTGSSPFSIWYRFRLVCEVKIHHFTPNDFTVSPLTVKIEMRGTEITQGLIKGSCLKTPCLQSNRCRCELLQLYLELHGYLMPKGTNWII